MKIIPYGHQQIDPDDIDAVVKVLESDWITQGPKIKELEKALCKYAGAKYAVAVSSGTAGLHIACLAAGIKKKDKVIASPITFAASANCILYCDGEPVFVDIQRDTANIDPEGIKKNISKMAKAILPVHFAGHPADMEEIYSIAKKHGLIVIEDAAHALGAEYMGSKIGSCKYSDMTIFSFHPVKSITTGEGGAVLTNKKDLYEKLLMLRNHGITKDRNRFTAYGVRFTEPWYYEQQYLGFNYRITDFQCALGISQLKKVDRFIKRRREIANIYNRKLSEITRIDLPTEKDYVKSARHLYPIRLKGRNISQKRRKIFNTLRAHKLGVQVHYIPVYLHPYYRNLGYKKGICPNAEEFYQRAISIPLHYSMSNKDVRYVIDAIAKAVKKS